jgi:hypothetical protein
MAIFYVTEQTNEEKCDSNFINGGCISIFSP